MIQEIINKVVKMCAGCRGLDPIKQAIIKEMAASGLNLTKKDYNYIFDNVLYKLALIEKRG